MILTLGIFPAYPRIGTNNRRNQSPKTPSGAPAGSVSQSRALKNIDNKLKNIILDEVVENAPGVAWSDIAGLDNAKQILQEIGAIFYRFKIRIELASNPRIQIIVLTIIMEHLTTHALRLNESRNTKNPIYYYAYSINMAFMGML